MGECQRSSHIQWEIISNKNFVISTAAPKASQTRATNCCCFETVWGCCWNRYCCCLWTFIIITTRTLLFILPSTGLFIYFTSRTWTWQLRANYWPNWCRATASDNQVAFSPSTRSFIMTPRTSFTLRLVHMKPTPSFGNLFPVSLGEAHTRSWFD